MNLSDLYQPAMVVALISVVYRAGSLSAEIRSNALKLEKDMSDFRAEITELRKLRLDLTEHKAEVHARVGAVEGWIHEVKPRLYSSDKNRAVTNAEIQNIKEKQRSSPDLSLYVPPLPRKDIP